jgi:aminoglycoside phosphotransferase (APT) family kinase protein
MTPDPAVDPAEFQASLSPLPGGWSGQTFVADAGGERSVVRIYANESLRGDRAHEVDAALLRLVRGIVPVPDVLEVRRGDPATGTPPLLITSFLPGVRGDELIGELDAGGLASLGHQLGLLLADLGGIPMPRAGLFVDGDLTIADLPGPDGLLEWVDHHAGRLTGFSADELTGLRELAEEAQSKLESVERHCLVHSDLNPKNLLVDPGTLAVTGLVDWEYAHAGHPSTDLGNLLRFDRHPAFVGAVLAAYVDHRGGEPDHVLDRARAADLWALVDLAARAADRPDNLVAQLAHELLRAMARTRDLHAVQPG